MTRSGLAERVGLTEASVSRIINECLQTNLIKSSGFVTESRAGRRSTLLILSSDRYAVAVVHIGYIWIDCSIVNLQLQELESLRILRKRSLGVNETLNQIVSAIRELSTRLPYLRILAMGVTIRASVDQEKGIIGSDNLMQWPDFTVSDVIRDMLDLPVVVESDITSMALVETRHRKLDAGEPLVLVSVGAAVGMGVAFNGEVLRGSRGLAGWLEALDLGTDDAHGMHTLGSILTDIAVLDACHRLGHRADTILDAMSLAEDHDEVRQVLADRARGLAYVLKVLTPIFDPRQFVISGACLLGNGFEMIAEAYAEVTSQDSHVPPVVRSSYGDRQTIIGAAYVTLLHVLSPNLVIDKNQGIPVASYTPHPDHL